MPLESHDLLLARMDRHEAKIDKLTNALGRISSQMAVLTDRQERQAVTAKAASMRWAAATGAIISAVVSSAIHSFRDG